MHLPSPSHPARSCKPQGHGFLTPGPSPAAHDALGEGSTARPEPKAWPSPFTPLPRGRTADSRERGRG